MLTFMQKQVSETEFQDRPVVEKPTLIVETLKEDPDAGWPSFGRLVTDLFKFAFEALGNIFLSFIPLSLRPQRFKKGLTPLKDNLVMPEDKLEPSLVQKHRSPPPLTETLQTPNTNKSHTQQKPPKSKHSLKDAFLSGKLRSSKRQDFSEFYGLGDAPQYGQLSSKSQKDRTRHRHRDKSGEAVFGATGVEPKPLEIPSRDYADPKFDHYNFRSKYGTDDHYHF